MDTRSPSKRRVLGGLDPNVASPRTHQPVLDAKKATLKPEHFVASPRSPSVLQTQSRGLPSPSPPREDSREPRKRSVPDIAPSRGEQEDQAEPTKKRPCLRVDAEQDVSDVRKSPVSPPRNTSTSPEVSPVFDNSLNDTSHVTAITEPDEQQAGTPAPANPLTAVAAAAVAASEPARRAPGSRLTPEQTRQRAERIRLRLSLAAYKVRTGQTDVPLEQLRRLPTVRPGATASSGSTSRSAPNSPRHALPPTAHSARAQQQQQQQGAAQDAPRDHRRPLPSGISLSSLGTGGVRRPTTQEKPPQQQQQQQKEKHSEARNDPELRSSPPVMPAARSRVVEEEAQEQRLPRLGPLRPRTTAERDAGLPDAAANGLLCLARG